VIDNQLLDFQSRLLGQSNDRRRYTERIEWQNTKCKQPAIELSYFTPKCFNDYSVLIESSGQLTIYSYV
jgi:hypothetical protein